MPISKDLLDILVCPESRAPLVVDGETLVSTDRATRRRYRIEDGIPNMLIEESEVLPVDEWKAIMNRTKPDATPPASAEGRDEDR